MKVVEEVTRGTFLVASPMLTDPNFVRTVVLMCDHSDEGSWGLVVNRRTSLTFGELMEDLPFPASAEARVLWGGPVEPSRMQVLHSLRRDLPEVLPIVPGVDLGLDADTFREVVGTPLVPGESLLAYVGHAGWGPGQLEQELEGRAWIVCTADARTVFETEPETMWEAVLARLGPEYARLVHVPPDPSVN